MFVFQGRTLKTELSTSPGKPASRSWNRANSRANHHVPDAPAGQSKSRLEPLRPLFQLLGLIYPHEDIARAYQSFRSGTRDSIAYAVELLDTILDKDLRDAVFPLIEDLPVEERRRRCLSRAGEATQPKRPE